MVWNTNDRNVLAFCLRNQEFHGLIIWYEERFGQLLPMCLPFFQQTFGLHLRWLRRIYRDERRAQDEATCRIHERDEVEVAVGLRADRRIVQLECDPSFVDLKLIRMEHGSGVAEA